MSAGESLVIKGELSSSEDLTIEGQVEGKIDLRNHTLTIGSAARIRADVVAKTVIVIGSVNGHVTALERVDLRGGGVVVGTLTSPRLVMGDGARLQGTVGVPKVEDAAAAAKT